MIANMAPAEVSPPGKKSFFVPNKELLNHQPEYEGIDEKTREEMHNWGPSVRGEKDGFEMTTFSGRSSYTIRVKTDKVTFYPADCEKGAVAGVPGFKVELEPPAVVLRDGTRVRPITDEEMDQAKDL